MALLQPNQSLIFDYGIVAATSKFQIRLWHCCSPTTSQIWLCQCCSHAKNPNLTMSLLQPNQNPKSDYVAVEAKNKIPSLLMALLQPTLNPESVAAKPRSQIWLWHWCSQTEIQHLTMAWLRPRPNPKSDYGIVAAKPKIPNPTMALLQPSPYPQSDYGIVAAERQSQIWLWHCCNQTKIQKNKSKIWLWICCSTTHTQNRTLALLQPKPTPQIWHGCSKAQIKYLTLALLPPNIS